MRPRKEAAKGRRLVAYGLAVAGVLSLGWLLGGGGSGGSPAQPYPEREGSSPELEVRSGVPVGFPHSSQGAAAAAAAYQRAFASPSILRPGVLRQRIEAVATSTYVRQMLSANGEGTARLAAGPLGAGLRSGLQTIYSAVPIGYAVESYRPGRARVLTWGFTLLGNAETVEPSAYFGTSTTELAWTGDGWRIASTRSGFGPTPQLATKPEPGGGFEVMRLARELRGYELAP